MAKSEQQKALDAATTALATEIAESVHIIRLTNRKMAALLQQGDLSARELTQIRKALNASLKTGPALLAAVANAAKAKGHAPMVLTEKDLD